MYRSLRIVIILILFLILLPREFIYCQYFKNCDINFISHLVNKADYDEALFMLNSDECRESGSNDSVNYFRGWSLYSTKQLLLSAESFLKVDTSSSFYFKSHFFAGYDYAHTGYFREAIKALTDINVTSPKLCSLQNLESAGISLLQKDYNGFSKSIMAVDTNFYELTEASLTLKRLGKQMMTHKPKSPVIAGLMSAIIPGSGKFYSGNKGGAISSFISTAGFGAVTIENYNKRGINDLKTIIFGSAFLVSYISGIYGSVISVNLVNTEYNENVTNTILFNIHIPLRNVFNE